MRNTTAYAVKNWRRNTTSGVEHCMGDHAQTVCNLSPNLTIRPMVVIHRSEVTRPCLNCVWSLETSMLLRSAPA